MENRFGFKDFVLLLVMVAVIVIMLFKMLQDDRQFKLLTQVANQMNSQRGDLAEISRAIKRGVPTLGTAGGGGGDSVQASDKGDPFVNMKKAQENPDFARGDWLIENFGVKFSRLTPLGTTGDLYGTIVRSRVQEWLAYRDPTTLQYLPLLARDWQIKDNSKAFNAFVEKARAAGKTAEQAAEEKDAPPAIEITFQLRKGVTFSDGQPMTADDVVFSFDWIMNPKVEAPRARAYYQKIRRVRKVNDHEVVFEFKEPYFESFDLASSLDIMPKHFYEKYGPEKFNSSPGLLMGTGPYMLRDPATWTPGVKLELLRNERYWGDPATFDRIVYLEVEGDNAEMVMFKNGEVDRFSCQPDQYVELLKDRALVGRSQHFEFSAPDSGYTFIAWNQQKGGKPTIFADKLVRQAMTLLTDRERMIKELFLGYASVASGPFTPLAKQPSPNVKAWPYDVNKAKSLLKQAGFEDRNGDGLLERADGTPLKLKLTYNSKNQLSQRIALFLKDGYARVGVALEPDPTDWPIMLKKMDSRDFDAITLGWSGGIETDIFQMFHSSQIKDAGDNFMSYNNPELDKYMEQARSTIDEATRMPLWHKCHEILHEDQPYTFLIDRKGLVFLDKRIVNVGPSKLGLNYAQRYVMPIPWYVPIAKQKWGK